MTLAAGATFIVIMVLIGLCVYAAALMSDSGTIYLGTSYGECPSCGADLSKGRICHQCSIDNVDEACTNPGKNKICLNCWGLIELNCGCPLEHFHGRWCHCAESRPYGGVEK